MFFVKYKNQIGHRAESPADPLCFPIIGSIVNREKHKQNNWVFHITIIYFNTIINY